MKFQTVAFSLASALLLAACNNVATQTPLFTREAVADAPAIREGMWGIRRDRCVLTASGRVPDGCPPPLRITATEIGEAGRGIAYVLVAGDPAVVQLAVRDPGENKTAYYYWGVDATARDDVGRLIEASIWPVQCGPLPKPETEAAVDDAGEAVREPTAFAEPDVRQEGGGPESDPVKADEDGDQDSGEPDPSETEGSKLFQQLLSSLITSEPYEGLTIEGMGCTASRGDAVIRAAAASRGWYTNKLQIYWIGAEGTLIAVGPRPVSGR